MKIQNRYSFNRIVLASYRVPFKIVNEDEKLNLVQNSGGLVSAMLSLSEKFEINFQDKFSKKIVWVGYSENSKEEFEATKSQNESFDIHPVNIPNDINDLYYGGFCNDTLWPLFHYFPVYTVFDENYYDAYVKANLLFFETLKPLLKDRDFIWVHDYQLFLLPQLIRQHYPNINIGFFLHIPFPSYEIFRLLNRKWQQGIINGILGADLIGFHTFDYTQHFLKSVRRNFGYEVSHQKIYTEERIIKVDAFPIGIDYQKFYQAAQSKEVKLEIGRLSSHLKDSKLIFSVDRLDYSKGIMNRLLGFEMFLEKYPQWLGTVIFNMVVVPSRDNIPRYKDMKKEIEANVGRINGKFSHIGWRPIVYQYKSLNFKELVALYSISHVGLITPLRDGMNLVAKEYVTCQEHNVGVLILSERAGAVVELGEAIIINPSDKEETADSINKALEMPEEERKTRISRMRKRLESYDVFTWTFDFINQLQMLKDEQKILDYRILNETVENQLLKDYQKSENRIIFLDYDGTLVPFSKYPDQALPTKKVIGQLEILSKDKKNTIIIISGRDKSFLEQYFGNLNLYLIAEHGVFMKEPSGNWQSSLNGGFDNSWKDSIRPVLTKYVERCNGSFIEEKESALVWHYRNAEIDFAFVRSNELKDELDHIIKHFKYLQVIEGNKIVEIKTIGSDKGLAAKQFLNKNNNSFVLSIGDDRTDEDLFKAMPDDAYSIKVGIVPSNAKYNLAHQEEVIELIDRLIYFK